MAGNYLEALAKAERAAEREERARLRELDALEKEAQRRYLQFQASEVDRMNYELDSEVRGLETLLSRSLSVQTRLDFAAFKAAPSLPVFEPGSLASPEPRPLLARFAPEEPRGLRRLSPGAQARYEHDCEAGLDAFQRAFQEHTSREAQREAALEAAKRRHQAEVEEIESRLASQHAEVDALQADFEDGRPEAVAECFSRVLSSGWYPQGFPCNVRVAYVAESEQLVVDCDLPTFAIVPEVASYRYVEEDDKIVESSLGVTSRRTLYTSVIAQMALRSIREVFEADAGALVWTVAFNGRVETIDAGTGRPIRPCIVTVRTTRGAFSRLDLSKVEPVACIKTLNASISTSPAELVAVRPVVEFEMVEPRLTSEAEALSGIDQRPNLLCLTPAEFEALIVELFERMGLKISEPQESDGGEVDCVAYDPRPIFGGAVVIRAGRHEQAVPVSAVQDLYGSVRNEGASKGLLVTTGGYDTACFEFAQGKPLELLSGSHLLYLLAEHAGIEARIERSGDWKAGELHA
ncbi:MAG: restriction endonuclease [Acidimicrobiia bacterium]